MFGRSWRQIFATAAIGALACNKGEAEAAAQQTAITIYSSALPGAVPAEYYRPLPGQATPNPEAVPGYAMVRQDRRVALGMGRTALRFADVAALIDPTTVQFVSLTDPDNTRVLEQNFQFDLVSTQKLLSRYVDMNVAAQIQQGSKTVEISGTLLSAGDGLVLRSSDGQIHALNQYTNLRFAELPGGLITRPTLLWDIVAPKAGEQTARVTYQTAGMTWWADYNLTFTPGADANSGFVDVGAWVSIINQSGATYADASLKLIAGDVQRVQPQMLANGAMLSMRVAKSADAGFAEKALFEYHVYTLGHRTSLANNSTKQLELFEAAQRVAARKTLIYSGQGDLDIGAGVIRERSTGMSADKKVDVYLEFNNDEKSGLGIPLPKGRVRVSQLDPVDRSLEFIGEDVIDHTPKNEHVMVKLGSAFDVVGERRQVDFSSDSKAKWMEEEFEVTVRNHKSEAVEVLVKENHVPLDPLVHQVKLIPLRQIRRTDRVLSEKIAADAEQSLRYRVRYTW